MDLATGIAIAGIWIGVGIACIKSKEGGLIAMFAMFATMVVAVVSC